MSEPDPFDLFRRLQPPAAESDAARDDALLATVLAAPHGSVGRGVRRPRRRTRWIAAGVVTAGALATAAWKLESREHAPNPLTLACFRTASLETDIAVIEPSADPVGACAAPWTDGTFGTGPVPELHACVSPTGIAAVFPGGADVCTVLGLHDLDSSFTAEEQKLLQLQDQLSTNLAAGCFGVDEARQQAEQMLADLHITGWHVDVTGPPDAQVPCIAAGFDPQHRQIFLGGRPNFAATTTVAAPTSTPGP